MDKYIRADNDFRQRRDEALRFSEMTRGLEGRFYPRHVRSIHNSTQNDDKASQQQRPQCSAQTSGHQQSSFRPPAPRGRGARGFGGRFGDQPRKIYCLFCGEGKGHTMHTASYHSPYIPEYVGNHPAASVASASPPHASWQQLPPPPPIQRASQPEGSQHSHPKRDFREESEARTVNSTVPESKHIY
jgi:hypothetical protein